MSCIGFPIKPYSHHDWNEATQITDKNNVNKISIKMIYTYPNTNFHLRLAYTNTNLWKHQSKDL